MPHLFAGDLRLMGRRFAAYVPAAMFAALAACSSGEQGLTSPEKRTATALRLSEGVEVSAVVSLRVTTYDHDRKVKQQIIFPKRRIKGIVTRGAAFGNVAGISDNSSGAGIPKSRGSSDAGHSPGMQAGRSLKAPQTPLRSYDEYGEPILLAVLDGELTEQYQETFFDSAGSSWMNRTTAGSPGAPVRTSDLYQNGIVRSLTGYEWTQTSGGYFLTGQVAHLYDEQGNLLVEIVEQTDPAAFALHSKSLTETRLASLGGALKDLLCRLGPTPLYAQTTSCGSQGVNMAISTGLLVGATGALAATYAGYVNPVTATISGGIVGMVTTGYLATWGLWTKDLYELGKCVNQKIKAGGGGKKPGDEEEKPQ